ncbi:carbon starvation CstA family protein [Nocardiopsis lambiniae]|uniref:Carbon starvation protein A n=1 Tax=Nocardiopsis lambiniae TaxID=3075539 RepID=A0ABU2MBJ2_9ACTN|nr:carbon starvation protein A [Nocardiopsis sp. DSM 44743]MDT0330048.1 carbon starvation protein A [Nocardiopsis sp. DSM 44743]
MSAVAVLLGALALFALGYRFYSNYLAKKVYALDPAFLTPAHAYKDGVDFVPTNKHIVFAHHFISVAGAAPIVGPAIAVFWGWGPALVWVVLGTIFASGAHDFGAIVVSVRHRAKSIGALAGDVISGRARILFLLIIFFLVTMVNAVFAVIIAGLFVANPQAVLPVLVTIPLAIGVGQVVYRRRTAALVPSVISLIVVYACIPLGQMMPITVDPIAGALGVDVSLVWLVLIFTYTFFTSRLPVWMLLQPRDYINQQQMVLALVVIVAGIVVGMNTIEAPVLRGDLPEGSPAIFPLLFITIACGAVSGFHSLVASGTTSKQLDKETDARYVGYLSSLGEGTLAVCSILACTAGIMIYSANQGGNWSDIYVDWAAAGTNPAGRFVQGVAGFASNIGVPEGIGLVFATLVVVSFAATSLDTAVRLQRYTIQEISVIVRDRATEGGALEKTFSFLARNITVATLIAVLVPFGLALVPGNFAAGTLWQLFGTTNQLTAGLALAVIAVWVTKRGRNPIAVLVPLAFLVVMTSWALVVQLLGFLSSEDSLQRYLLAPLDAVIFGLAVWMTIEAAIALRKAFAARRGGTAPADEDAAEPEAAAEGTAGPDDRA